jgi:hypothetical protein
MHNAAHNVVVPQGQQIPALSRPRVPAAEADGPLVRQQHVVLGVVKDGLCPVHLPSTQARACHRNQDVKGLWTKGSACEGSKFTTQTSECSTLFLNVPWKKCFKTGE